MFRVGVLGLGLGLTSAVDQWSAPTAKTQKAGLADYCRSQQKSQFPIMQFQEKRCRFTAPPTLNST